ncbi:MAG: hypothetical protein PF508_04005 [Spirochaeta sp.]|jgi:hypothetical protein|nr:hypothetical protein [Spirochaeta sp.]
MKKSMTWWLVVLPLFAVITAGVTAQSPTRATRVAVLPPEDRLGTLDVIAQTIRETIELNLRFVEGYKIVSVVADTPTGDQTLRELADAAGVDAIVFGSVARLSTGELAFELSFYEREADESRLAAEVTAESVFDVFEAGDRIALEFLNEISGTQVAYGSLALNNQGVQRSYRVFLNGSPVGTDLVEVPRLIVGRYDLTIEVDGLAGPEVLVSQSVDIVDGQTTAVGFVAPSAVAGAESLARIVRAIISDWAVRPAEAEALFVRVLDGLAALDGQEELQAKYRAWQAVLAESDAAGAQVSTRQSGADPLYLVQQSLPDIDLVGQRPEMGHHRRGLGEVLPADVTIDGNSSEWANARAFTVDSAGDIPIGMDYDLKAAYVVFDTDAVYLMVEGHDSLATFVKDAWLDVELVALRPETTDESEVNHLFSVLRPNANGIRVEHDWGMYMERDPTLVRDVDAAWGDVIEVRIPMTRIDNPEQVRLSDITIYGAPPEGATTGILPHGARATHNRSDTF